jgi:hypothetical protein
MNIIDQELKENPQKELELILQIAYTKLALNKKLLEEENEITDTEINNLQSLHQKIMKCLTDCKQYTLETNIQLKFDTFKQLGDKIENVETIDDYLDLQQKMEDELKEIKNKCNIIITSEPASVPASAPATQEKPKRKESVSEFVSAHSAPSIPIIASALTSVLAPAPAPVPSVSSVPEPDSASASKPVPDSESFFTSAFASVPVSEPAPAPPSTPPSAPVSASKPDSASASKPALDSDSEPVSKPVVPEPDSKPEPIPDPFVVSKPEEVYRKYISNSNFTIEANNTIKKFKELTVKEIKELLEQYIKFINDKRWNIKHKDIKTIDDIKNINKSQYDIKNKLICQIALILMKILCKVDRHCNDKKNILELELTDELSKQVSSYSFANHIGEKPTNKTGQHGLYIKNIKHLEGGDLYYNKYLKYKAKYLQLKTLQK